jgi:1,4-dihydroxy-2-naphthoate polyprenyltransferase
VSTPRWPRVLIGVYLELRVVPVMLWSFSAITLGSSLGWSRSGAVGWLVAAWTIGLLLQGAVAHCVNELTDWRSGTDRDPAPRVLSGGSKVVRAGLLTERELIWMGTTAACLAVALGTVICAARGWWLVVFGGVGVVGAVLYTLPPVAAAYRPFAGEAVAVICVWACAVGGYAVQAGTITGSVALVGAAHAAYCISMLMFHHALDRGPDSRATPPKRTTLVWLDEGARAYGVAWSVCAAALATAATVLVTIKVMPLVVAAVLASVLHVRADLTDAQAVTTAETVVIVAGIAAALAGAIWITPSLWWTALVPVAMVPIEALIAGRWLTPALSEHPEISPDHNAAQSVENPPTRV